jgi:hypothetical protein
MCEKNRKKEKKRGEDSLNVFVQTLICNQFTIWSCWILDIEFLRWFIVHISAVCNQGCFKVVCVLDDLEHLALDIPTWRLQYKLAEGKFSRQRGAKKNKERNSPLTLYEYYKFQTRNGNFLTENTKWAAYTFCNQESITTHEIQQLQ